jgi:hypothetical protein
VPPNFQPIPVALMRRSLFVFGLLFFSGCSGLGLGHPLFHQGAASPNCGGEQVAEGQCGQPGCCQRAPECKPAEEIHVQVPQQKITVKRSKPEKPEAPPTAAVPSQEILLVPRTVYLPYAPQVPTGPARMVPLQTTPAQTTTMVPVVQAPAGCGADAHAASALAETQRQMEELARRLQQLEGTLQRLNQTAAQLGLPATTAPAPPPNREPDLPAPGR